MSVTVSRVKWEEASDLLKNVREKVFICEWRIPKQIEFDHHDSSAYHMLVCDDYTQEPIATGRISPNGEIGRIAVLMGFRKQKIDKIVLQGLISIAKELELPEIYIYSPLDSVDYFSKNDFIAKGGVFMEAGIPRQRMACSIENLGMTNCYLSH